MDKMIKAAIFDIDGTLLDSTGIWRGLGERFLVSRGITPPEGLDEILRCLSLEDGAEYLHALYPALSAQDVLDSTNRMVERFYLDEVQARRGASEMLALLESRGIAMGLATAGALSLSARSLERLGLRKFFPLAYSCGDFGGKHLPNIFLAAAEALGAKPCETLVFEDSYHSAKTAADAGFIVAAVHDSGEPNQDALRGCARFYGNDLEKLLTRISALLG